MTQRQTQLEHDLEILREFTEIYCREQHQTCSKDKSHAENNAHAENQIHAEQRPRNAFRGRDDKTLLCVECQDLLDYALALREKCPLDPKPTCKLCPVHCYQDRYRQRIREVMRFSGMWMVRHGRFGTIARHVLAGVKSRLRK